MKHQLMRIGTGIITEDKDPDVSLVYLYLVDDISEIGKEIVGFEEPVANEHKDTEGTASSDTATRGMSVRALYINKDTNQTSVPDVVTGEIVDVFQIGNDPQYFWSTGFQKSKLRKHEHVITQYSNKLDPEDLTEDNTYTVTYSTRDKYIKLTTTKDQDETEPCTYEIKLDTKKGVLSIIDDQENSIVLESMKKKVTITTLDVLVDAPNSRFTGNVLIDKNLTVKGNTDIKGNTDVGGKTKSKAGFFSGATMVKKKHDGHIFPG